MNTVLMVLIGWMVFSSVLCIAIRKRDIVSRVMPFCTVVQLVLASVLCWPVMCGDILDEGLFYMDRMSAVFRRLTVTAESAIVRDCPAMVSAPVRMPVPVKVRN